MNAFVTKMIYNQAVDQNIAHAIDFQGNSTNVFLHKAKLLQCNNKHIDVKNV